MLMHLLIVVCSAANSGVPNYQTDAHLTILDTDEWVCFVIKLAAT